MNRCALHALLLVLAVCALALPGCGRISDGFYRLRGDAFRHANKHRKALRCYTRVSTNRRDAAILCSVAECYVALDDFTNLVETYRAVWSMTDDTLYLDTLIWLNIDHDEPAAAIPDIREMIKREPDNWTYRELLVVTLMQTPSSNDAAAALAEFERDLPATRTNSANIAALWLRAGSLSNAARLFRQALAEEPESHALRLVLATVETEMEQYPQALSNLLLIAEAEPENADAYQLLGYICGEAGERERAVQYFRRAIQLDQQNVLALNNLAYFLLLMDTNVKEAFEFAQSAVQLDRASHTLDTLAYAYYRRGRFDAALRYLKEAERMLAVEGKPRDPEIDFHFSVVHAERGEIGDAVPRLRAALSKKPELEEMLRCERYYPELKPHLLRDNAESSR